MLKVIIDFDGTLTAEEEQVVSLADLSLATLAREFLAVPQDKLEVDYRATRSRLLASPHRYWWEVNGLIASYCDEGAFILNTTTIQVMLRENPDYLRVVTEAFPEAEYDPVVDCSNFLFHRHTAELTPRFRAHARELLTFLQGHEDMMPMILTNSLGDKVRRYIRALELGSELAVLGDTRQYDMQPDWGQRFPHPTLGEIQIWPVLQAYQVDLRRPAYYRALVKEAADGSQLAVVADTFSLPGSLPLMMCIPFFLLRTAYTPSWCLQATESHPFGRVLEGLDALPAELDALLMDRA